MKAIMKYPGSKWSLADWIIDFFPDHHSYLEPFFGSGAVLFNKSRSNIETVNDLDGNVVNLFECMLCQNAYTNYRPQTERERIVMELRNNEQQMQITVMSLKYLKLS